MWVNSSQSSGVLSWRAFSSLHLAQVKLVITLLEAGKQCALFWYLESGVYGQMFWLLELP